ncbi:class I SAM-dependent methyltransferase [Cohnella suwonensis]|uniref:Class I SAM-dependent methyltransferase n=1 Tax=Cohnella suwonensis TaxID=696072 RepID=A0ABW0LYY9_9BACL
MPDHDRIYAQEAPSYHEMISKQQPLADVVGDIRPFSGLDVVDIGAGTGRLSVELAPDARSLVALDASGAMLRENARHLEATGARNWRTAVADHRELPLPDDSADLIVSGWSVCYLTSRNSPEWELNLERVLAEMRRVLRPGGTIILFETMGTGFETPNPPDFLLPYYAALTDRYGFSHRWLRTDYRFDDVAQAERLARFFFGDGLADRIARERLAVLPECAGVWWLHL